MSGESEPNQQLIVESTGLIPSNETVGRVPFFDSQFQPDDMTNRGAQASIVPLVKAAQQLDGATKLREPAQTCFHMQYVKFVFCSSAQSLSIPVRLGGLWP